jgi:hypothetical protein
LAGLAAAVALVALIVAPDLAGAQGVGVQAAKNACDNAIAARVANLVTAQKDLDATPSVDAAIKTSLDGQIGSAISGLQSLKPIIDGDTTLIRVRADCRRIVTGYYVYVLLIPKIQLVRATGRVQAAAATLKHLAGVLQATLDAARARTRDTTSAQGFVTDLGLKADAATKAVAGTPAAVVPLDAAGFPGNRPTLVSARASLDTARGALKGAVAATTSALNAIKALG